MAERKRVVCEYPPNGVARRGLLAGFAWGTLAAAMLLGGLATLRYLWPNVVVDPPQTS